MWTGYPERASRTDAPERRRERLRALLAITDLLTRAERLDPMVLEVVAILLRTLPIAGAQAVVLVEREVLASAALWTSQATRAAREGAIRRLSGRLSYFGASPEPESELTSVRGAVKADPPSVVLPLIAGGDVFGAVELLSPSDELDEDDLVFANAAAHSLAAATSRAARAQRAMRITCDRLEARYRSAPVGLLSLTHEGDLVDLNDAAARLLGVDRRAIGMPLHAFLTNADAGALLEHVQACVARVDRLAAELVVTPRSRRDRRLLLVSCRDNDAGASRCSSALVDVTARERERDEHEAQLEAALRSASGDPASALDGLCAALVPRVADLCLVDVAEDGGARLRRRAFSRNVDPARGHRFAAVEERWGMLSLVAFAELDALRSGEVQLIPFVTAAQLESHAVDGEHLQELLGLALRSWLIVPLFHPRERMPLATLRLATAGIRRPFDEGDARLLELTARLVRPSIASAFDLQRVQRPPPRAGA